jgi:uncharacterized protein (DUF1501 family)
MKDNETRRAFLQRTSALGALGAAAPWALNMAAVADAAAQSAGDDYKALVFVFLYGGNDHNNTIIPLDLESHSSYSRHRGNIAFARSDIEGRAVNPDNPWPAGREFAFNPNLSPLIPLFDSGKLALMMSLGTLVGQLTPAEAKRGLGLPAKLGSHSDQAVTWHRGAVESAYGYGGRMSDLVAMNSAEHVALSVINASPSTFLTGGRGGAYRIGPGGAGVLGQPFKSHPVHEAVRRILIQDKDSAHFLQSTLANIASHSMDLSYRVNQVFGGVSIPAMPQTSIGQQLGAIARMIGARSSFGVKRQVFFAAVGGYDTHSGMPQNHGVLLWQLAEGLSAFYAATEALGVADKVTTFTGSDFGRTLSSNGDGTDHGWGSYQFVLGGAVRGRQWWGRVPIIASNGPDDMGGGSLIPAIGVDQYMATLATWFGVPKSSLADLIPRIGRYDVADLGFMR